MAGIIFSILFCILGFPILSFSQTQTHVVFSYGQVEGKWQVQVGMSEGELSVEDFKVYVGTYSELNLPTLLPIFGNYEIQSGQIIFRPTFSFQEGLNYTAIFQQQYFYEFLVPLPTDFKQTQVTNIYPTGNALPANLLKMYLHFSAPMSEGKAYEFLHFLNEQGDTLDLPFLKLQPELWDANRQRLTLWLDPGRVKRALRPNENLGVPLEIDKLYQLVISHDWKDAQGHFLKEDFEKTFRVKTADRIKPNVENWVITTPKAHTKTPLKIAFREALDAALVLNTIEIWNEKKERIEGMISIEKEESVWVFRPVNIWKKGIYMIEVQSVLEDLAGNNLNRLFDRDLEKGEEAEAQAFFEIKVEVFD